MWRHLNLRDARHVSIRLTVHMLARSTFACCTHYIASFSSGRDYRKLFNAYLKCWMLRRVCLDVPTGPKSTNAIHIQQQQWGGGRGAAKHRLSWPGECCKVCCVGLCVIRVLSVYAVCTCVCSMYVVTSHNCSGVHVVSYNCTCVCGVCVLCHNMLV